MENNQVNIPLTLPKEERIHSQIVMDSLFTKGKSFVQYPLRVVYLTVEKRQEFAPVMILVNAPKRKFKRANKRNRIKRVVKEAYRLQKRKLIDTFSAYQGKSLAIAFLYIGTEIEPYEKISVSMHQALAKIERHFHENS